MNSTHGAAEHEVVFNVVFTPHTFEHLLPFTRSLLARSSARFRLITNGCDPDEVAAVRAFAARRADRIDSFVADDTAMLPHGAVLEAIWSAHDDGAHFCFIDSDVVARGPFVGEILELRAHHDVVTTGDVAWVDDRLLPAGSIDLVGRHAIGHDGFMYGSSYVACYSRPAVAVVRDRWGVTFRAGSHDQLDAGVQRRLEELGRAFRRYDTAKALNLLLVGEGLSVHHFDHPALFHLGGISQYLSSVRTTGGEPERPWFARSGAGSRRWEFAEWAANALRALARGDAAPRLPDDPADADIARTVLAELTELVRVYGHDHL